MLKGLIKTTTTFILVPVFFLALSLNFNEEQQGAGTRTKRMADRGLYVTYYMSLTSTRFAHIKEQARKSGLNTIVVDAKHVISQPLLKLAKEKKLNFMSRIEPDPWLSKLTEELHAEGFIVSVRLVVFKDDHLVLTRPDLGVKMPNGELYRDLKGGKWADPYSDEVRLFNELVAERAAMSGADEIQFDYIRFPAERKSHLAVYPFEKPGMSKIDCINTFLRDTRHRLSKYNVSLAVDIFGVTAWQGQNDSANLGQDLKQMAKYIDVISPMFYPSHFHSGYDGYANPGSEPYHFIYTGVKRALDLLSGESVAVVPWLQGFNLRSPNFGPKYIEAQIQACKDAGTSRYLIWNA
ncbi:MAG: putative glycoside hydrolase, partial [Candidatus Margulisbacteria bacterium]|nr:putative glycoside hydrolase [Candidatus Margulisiibacteriota bacterium]